MMRWLRADFFRLLTGSVGGQIRLLLMLSAALLGFFWLLDYLASLVATSPQDILASSPGAEEFKSVPTGVALLELSAFALAVVLAAVVLVTTLGWPVARSSFRLSPSLVLGVLSSAAVLAGGAYVAFSGVLERRLSYDRHLVEGSLLESGALVALTAVFFSLAIAGVVNRKSLVAVLAAWLVIGLASGFLNPQSLDGLDLFERTIRHGESAAYASVVEKYMRTFELPDSVALPAATAEPGTDALDDAAPKDATSTSPGKVPPAPGDDAAGQPVFRVAGAAHTGYLRVATGDVYESGEWRQLESQTIAVGPGIAIDDAVDAMIQRLGAQSPDLSATGGLSPALLGRPLATPSSVETNTIRVFPPDDSGAIEAGVVPISRYPTAIDTAGTYDPFSATLTVPERISAYEWTASVPQFTLEALVSAEAATDAAYLQLPDDLPERVRQVAEQFSVSRSPFLNANQIVLFMEEELTYLPGDADPEQPPGGSDPVDWLLFDGRAGDYVSYSTAFVVLARAAGIPARVVSGWVIEELEGVQEVHAHQFHHWAEIALEDVGWITFDPASRVSRIEYIQEIELDQAVEMLAGSEDPAVRIEAVEALGEIGSEEVLPWLLEALEYDPAEEVRRAAAVALQKLDFDMLVWILLNHQDPEMRAAAAGALNVLRDARAAQPFLQALSRDEHAPVRVEVAEGLAHIGKNRAESGLLLAATTDSDSSVREAAVRSLGVLGTGWTARQLVSILGSDTEAAVRRAAAKALGQIGAAVALPPLIEARSADEDATVREAAGGALMRWSSRQLMSVLEESWQPDERAAAAQLLGEREFTAAIPALSVALYDPSEEVRSAALTALGGMGELTWLENGLGLLTRPGGYFALIPGTTAEVASETLREPVFELSGGSDTNLLRNAVGDYYVDRTWLPIEQLRFSRDEPGTDLSAAEVPRTLNPGYVYRNEVSVYPVRGFGAILPGSAPTSYRLESISDIGAYWPNSATYVIAQESPFYEWVSEIHEFSPTDLDSAGRWPTSEYSYTELQERPWLDRARDLAVHITGGESTAYGKAKAIEQYMQSEYTYRFAEPGDSSIPPPDRDPLDWFLFESREGTSGSFSSAFVILARLAGVPARVVSGWAITAGSESQHICTDQAHQWAEVAFDGPGWVSFDPTPGGAPSRASLSCDPEEISQFPGGNMTRLENGSVVSGLDGGVTFTPATTTLQAQELPHIPVFNVRGAGNTSYLRTAVGDVYQTTHWAQLDPVSVPYAVGEGVPATVRRPYDARSGRFAWVPDHRLETEALFGFHDYSDGASYDRIHVYPAEERASLPAGLLPTSLHMQSADQDGAILPFSATFTANAPPWTYQWTSEIASYSEQQLSGAVAASDPTYTRLPERMPARVRELAETITSGYATTYEKAKALERYLSTNYTYAFADSSRSGDPPPGRDPTDWFLFDHREGTCGVFSSAFVVLARSIGIPARVVSGWAISATDYTQTVYLDQAHQWAEVAFEGLGWVTFEPTAPGSAVTRAAAIEPTEETVEQDGNDSGESDVGTVSDAGTESGTGEDGGAGADGDAGTENAQDGLWGALVSGDVAEREEALRLLEEQGAEVIRLEDGSALVRLDDELVFIPGTTTQQATLPPHVPVFNVVGAGNTGYLRTAVGEIYAGGNWAQLDPVTVPYASGDSVPGSFQSAYSSRSGQFASLPEHRLETESLFGFREGSVTTNEDRITVYPLSSSAGLPAGLVPTSLHTQSANRNGEIYPFSSTFATSEWGATFTWKSEIPSYSTGRRAAAVAASDPTYTQLPADLPGRIRELALRITAGHNTTYAKAKALERYLSTNYTYAFADSSRSGDPPPGRDPSDWFLFDHREGTCGVFSSAFVLLARSVGIPARVVSGWLIDATDAPQTVYAIQSHQWAEVPFEGLGWVTFEPTAGSELPDGATATPPPPIEETVTTITRWPAEVRRQVPFIIGGNVTTEDGRSVSGLEVEIYVNETKELGGTLLGTATTTSNGYQAEVTLPTNMDLGSYQLLARTIGTDRYYESRSDPDISVYSGSGLELTGPAEVRIDVEAIFRGRLSDDNDQGVAGGRLIVNVDGASAPLVVTDSSGRYSFSRTFSSPGPHWVEVAVEDAEFLLESTARLNFQVTLPTETVLHAPAFVEVGEEFVLTGELRDIRGMPLAQQDVYFRIGEGPERSVVTDDSGHFQFADTVHEAGEFTATATFRRNGAILSSSATARLSSKHGVVLTIDGPGFVEQGQGATFVGRLESDTATPAGELEMTMENNLERETFYVTTEEDGTFEYHHASFQEIGPHSLIGLFAGDNRDGEFLLGSTARLDFQVTLSTETVLNAPNLVDVGKEFTVTGVLRDLRRAPVVGADVSVQLGDGQERTVVTNHLGHFNFSATVYEAGEFTASATFKGDGSVLSSTATASLSSQHGVVLTIEGPGLIEQGEGATFVGTLESETTTPTGELELTIENSLERESLSVTTDEDGGFEYNHPSFQQTGIHTLTGSFAGGDSLGPSTAGISFRVAAPTLMTLRGPKGVRDGESFEVTGTLLQRNGRAVPDAEVQVGGEEPLTLVTDNDGRFSWEAVAELDATESEQSSESELFIEVNFGGTDHLGPSSASLGVAVGLPRIVVDELEPVARGDTAVLRGTVLVGSIPLADVTVSIDEDESLRSNEIGGFTYDYHVSASLPLGTSEIVVSAEEIGASVTVPVVVMSAPSLTFEQAEESVPGKETLLSATLVDDKGAGIPQAALRSSQGVEAVTDGQGVALFEVTVPETEEPALVPLTFTFDGDSRHMPHSATFVLAVQPLPAGFNWLLWLGLPALVAVTVAATLARRKLMALPEAVVGGRRRTQTQPVAAGDEVPDDGEETEARQEASLEIVLVKAAAGLPDIWGTGEDVHATVSLTGREGQPIVGASITASLVGADEPSQLVTDERGRCDVSWTRDEPGEYRVSAEFDGDEFHLPASASHRFRVVDFREEIVSLYGVFLEWAAPRATGITEQSTPREVELMLVSEGVPVDQKSLDELISRFEEADYSEHPITRRHYAAMYRAWRTVLGA